MRPAVLIALGVAVGIVVGCREQSPVCYEGELQACTCAGSKNGYQQCLQAEERYAACVCDGTTPGLDASVDASEAAADAASEASSKVAFMGVCAKDEDCETGQCHDFAAKGSFCSHACKAPTDCEPPSGGCNNQGVCKAP
jgi:hypothetical protein